ncbi:NADP-dependent oxidoreductase domain-containing protein [Melampsora americana]|nr:NADP-dependent oxidoreductase domain-containing protein [Melampsora americana]
MSNTEPFVQLNDGSKVPRIAYGSGTAWKDKSGPDGIHSELREATLTALSSGYTHLDTAKVYGNERSTGAAIEVCGMKRDQLYITTKILNPMNKVKETLKVQLSDLKLDYVDLYLIHTPNFVSEPGAPSLQEAWKMMEEIQSEGLAKSIGVSNYMIHELKETLKIAKVKPAVNQIEFHPYVWTEAEPLLKFMKEEGIALAAYGPQIPVVKKPGGKLDPILERISKKRNLTDGQVLLKWAKAHNAIVVTTSGKEERMKLNLEAVMKNEEDLSDEEIEEINKAGKENGVQRVFIQNLSQ